MSLCADTPAVTCDRCLAPVRVAFIVGGRVAMCGTCYDAFQTAVVKIEEYNAAVDMVAASKKKRK